MSARYAHTNLIAADWKRLAAFYRDVLGCVPVPPERDLSGEWLDRATGLAGKHISGVHLRLPGYGDEGPTLEIFQYSSLPERLPVRPDSPDSRTSPLQSMTFRPQLGRSSDMAVPSSESSRPDRYLG